MVRDISLEVGFLLRNWRNYFKDKSASRALDALYSGKALRLNK